MSLSFTRHRFTSAWRAFRNPGPRWTINDGNVHHIAMATTPDRVSVEIDGRAITLALREYRRRNGLA